MMASLRCVLAWVLNIPISRRKTEFGPCIQWIGWPFHVIAGYISLPQNKIDHIAEYISTMQNSSKTFKKFLENLVSLLNWIPQNFLLMRCWFTILYCDLYNIPASHYSINPGHWTHIIDCLDDNLPFILQTHGTSFPVGSTLLAVRHQEVQCKADLHQIYPSERRT